MSNKTMLQQTNKIAHFAHYKFWMYFIWTDKRILAIEVAVYSSKNLYTSRCVFFNLNFARVKFKILQDR